MKKITLSLITAFLLFLSVPNPLNAKMGIIAVAMDSTKTIELAETKALTVRLGDIKATDKSALSASERKQLRKEARTIKSELRERRGGGIYISVGALVIIVLLLVLLL